MTDDICNEFTKSLISLGYQNVHSECGTVHYDELDGTHHYLIEHTPEHVTRYIVTAVDCGETCDGKATVLGVFKTRSEAQKYAKYDMECWHKQNCANLKGINVDYDRLSITDDDQQYGCEWKIHEYNIELN